MFFVRAQFAPPAGACGLLSIVVVLGWIQIGKLEKFHIPLRQPQNVRVEVVRAHIGQMDMDQIYARRLSGHAVVSDEIIADHNFWQRAAYSTVTDLARFLGLSTSHLRRTAIS